MKLKELLKYKKIIIGFGVPILLLIIAFFNLNFLVSESSAKTGPALNSLASVKPVAKKNSSVSLIIPKLKINTNLEEVGLTAQGAVGIPKDNAKAAWFNLGPRPGATGTAVVVGHYGYWKNGTRGMFNNLSKLRVGDKIQIENGQGSSTVFVVKNIKSFNLNEDVSTVFNSDDKKAHLNLITCGGAWNEKTKSFAKRLVIFTDKVD